jgi:hypothetical protein
MIVTWKNLATDMNVKSPAEWEQDRPRLLKKLQDFAAIMKHRPFDNEQGLRGVSAFALYWFIQEVQPTAVFEVGVWKGFSTWIIRRAAPKAKVFSFDPLFMLESFLDMSKVGPIYRDPTVSYMRDEFSCANIAELAGQSSRPLVFFDDHQNKLPRVFQAKDAGIKHIIFDDNESAGYTHRTLEQDRSNINSARLLDQLIDRYEVFPALWDIDALLNGVARVKENGMDFPIKPELMEIYREREWHSYVTYVRLR